MELYLLRHGLAVERGTPELADDDRPLTPEGRRALRKIAQGMKRMDFACAAIYSSPLLRARQTAEIVAAELKLKRPIMLAADLRPGADAPALLKHLATLRPKPKSVLLVGHEPDLSELISRLITGVVGIGFALKKGGLAKLEMETWPAEKGAMLAWLLTPKQIKAMR